MQRGRGWLVERQQDARLQHARLQVTWCLQIEYVFIRNTALGVRPPVCSSCCRSPRAPHPGCSVHSWHGARGASSGARQMPDRVALEAWRHMCLRVMGTSNVILHVVNKRIALSVSQHSAFHTSCTQRIA